MSKHRKCPKCSSGSRRILPVRCFFETRYKVKCPACGFEIDEFKSRDEAWEVWDGLTEGRNT